MQLKKNEVDLNTAETKRAIADLQVVPPAAPAGGRPAYACRSSGSMANGYWQETVHRISGAFFTSSCLWAVLDHPVTSVTGTGYVIEWPNPHSAGRSFQCPGKQFKNCAVFLNTFTNDRDYPDKRFRVLVTADGNVTFNN